MYYSVLNNNNVCRNHAWVSFQGFCEAYNDTFSADPDADSNLGV